MLYRPEHPNPQFERKNWQNLNGTWAFEADPAVSGEARGLFWPDAPFTETINVPFCIESKLSGLARRDFINSVWYRRTVTVMAAQLAGRVLLHFGGVDYRATVYVNGQKAGTHVGGYVSFHVDITDYLQVGENTLTVNARDDTRDSHIPTGKQSVGYESYGCSYTRTTGIWQTVWLEYLPATYIKSAKYLPDTESATVTVLAELMGAGELTVEATFEGRPMGRATVTSEGGRATLTLPLAEKHLWQVGHGNLYDLRLTYGEDEVKSYCGLRRVSISGNRVLINGEAVFQRLVLDQGFYPDGIYTAPSEEELVGDIHRSLAMGFNGARLHEKVFEQRFLYHCDRLGYIVWGEYPNWGLDHTAEENLYGILPEWLEEIERDFNHPAIITWCPFNETWTIDGRRPAMRLIEAVYRATKAADPTRPCVDTSGGFHGSMTDIYDIHDYAQDSAVFAAHYAPLAKTGDVADFFEAFKEFQHYDGSMPFCVSEYGGIAWAAEGGWGYGNAPQTEREFLERLEGLTDVLLGNEHIFGFCYTQLTDVEQEKNGLYTYDRHPKFPPEEIHRIMTKKAAMEE